MGGYPCVAGRHRRKSDLGGGVRLCVGGCPSDRGVAIRARGGSYCSGADGLLGSLYQSDPCLLQPHSAPAAGWFSRPLSSPSPSTGGPIPGVGAVRDRDPHAHVLRLSRGDPGHLIPCRPSFGSCVPLHRVVDTQGYVNVDTNRYSVPDRLTTKEVEVHKTYDSIEVGDIYPIIE